MDSEEVAPAAPATARVGESALDHNRERYASLFTHHPHAAYSVDSRGYYTDANPHALAMTGLSLEQMRQTHFAKVIHPDDLHLIQDGFDRAIGGDPQVVEARVVRIDGEVIDIRCTMIPLIVDGETVGVHGITEDVSAAKQLLRQLQAANAAKTLFLATMSHEVRTPLAVLVGATDLLMDVELEPEPEHYLRMVHRSTQRLVRLVEDILEFSGLEANRTVLQEMPFAVREIIEEVADWAVPFAQSRDLALSLVVDEGVPTTAVGDGLRIRQVVTNLVQNAIKFTTCGSVDVRVSSRGSAPDPDDAHPASTWVEFRVSDTGIGIPQDRVQTLFQPFAQAAPHLACEHPGAGLGLAICHELVDLLGGQIRVTSTVGEGSTFTFGVPLGCVVEQDDSSSVSGTPG